MATDGRDRAEHENVQLPAAELTSYVPGAHFTATDQEPSSIPPCAGTDWVQLLPRRRDLFDRIRDLTPQLQERERALFGLAWLQLNMLDDVAPATADWTLRVLDTLVRAFETAEAPAATEPP